MKRLRILVLSELFPNPSFPAFGIFVERQTFHLQSYCDNVVISPVRIFPPLRIWKRLFTTDQFLSEWRKWQKALNGIPEHDILNGIKVYYPRYTSLPKQGFHGLWGFFAYLFVVPLLRELHSKYRFDLIHAHYASPCGVMALLAHRWMKVPIVLSVHGMDVTYTAKQYPFSAAVIRWVFHNVDAIIANSSWTKRQVIRYGGNPDKVQVIRLGAGPPIDFETRGVHRDSITLLSVGYLEERKGHAYVLHALKKLVERGYKLKYVIVGDGSQRERLNILTDRLGLNDIVSFEGYKAHAEVWPYFENCDIFVLPSWDEGFGIVYIEALSLGKPVVGGEGAGGPEDLKALGDCIELVKPRDVESLVLALERLINDPERRQRMGEIGQSLVREYFTWERNAVETFALYQKVLSCSA